MTHENVRAKDEKKEEQKIKIHLYAGFIIGLLAILLGNTIFRSSLSLSAGLTLGGSINFLRVLIPVWYDTTFAITTKFIFLLIAFMCILIIARYHAKTKG